MQLCSTTVCPTIVYCITVCYITVCYTTVCYTVVGYTTLQLYKCMLFNCMLYRLRVAFISVTTNVICARRRSSLCKRMLGYCSQHTLAGEVMHQSSCTPSFITDSSYSINDTLS